MPGPNMVLDKGYKANGAVTQFRGVVLADDTSVTQAAAAGARCVGISQETATAQDATDGRIINVRVQGISRAVASAAVTRDARVAVQADGRFAAATATQVPVGIALTAAAAAGDHFNVELTPGMPAV